MFVNHRGYGLYQPQTEISENKPQIYESIMTEFTVAPKMASPSYLL